MTTHMTHREIQQYLDNVLSPAQKGRITLHLQTCASCQQELDEYRQLFHMLKSDAGFELSPDFCEKIMAELPATHPGKKAEWEFWWAFLGISLSAVVSWLLGANQLVGRLISHFQPLSISFNFPWLGSLKNMVQDFSLQYMLAGLTVIVLIILLDYILFNKKTTFLV